MLKQELRREVQVCLIVNTYDKPWKAREIVKFLILIRNKKSGLVIHKIDQ